MRTLTRKEVEAAVLKLARAFGFDPHLARVFQLELGATLPMPRPVVVYLSLLGYVTRFQRVTYEGETVMYRTAQRSLVFYDKAKKERIEGDLLRFEVQFTGKLKYQLGWPVVLSDLYDAARYDVLVQRWLEEYRRVGKICRPVLLEPTSAKDLKHQLARAGLAAVGGEGTVRAMLGGWDMERHVRFACNRLLRVLASGGQSQEDATLITELDAAIDRAARLALQ